MKKLLLLTIALFLSSTLLLAQNDCSSGRYNEPVFQEVLITPGILFGMAPLSFDTLGLPFADTIGTYPLLMDIYQPLLDTAPGNRPVIVFAFGGAFVYGARVSPDIVQLCTMYAQMGYVCVSIDYRLSDELLINPSAANATRAVLKGTHDMRSAVRYLRRQAVELGNLMRIDTNQIYAGGVSAGAFCAIHTAYLDKDSEIPPILQDVAAKNGGLEGRSGNPGYSSKVVGVINLCGAIGDTAWIEPGDVPIVSMHGTADGTVPYDADTLRALDINYFVHGSASIHRHLTNMNAANPTQAIPNAFYTWIGADHVPFLLDTAYFDTTFRFTRDFMHTQVCPNSVGNGISERSVANSSVNIFPNPASEIITIAALEANYNVELIDSQGRIVAQTKSVGVEAKIKVENLPSGIYLAHVFGNRIDQTQRVVIE